MTDAASGIPSETGYAKLNLALHVRRREPGGYHALETLFAFCEDGDTLTIEAAPGLRVTGEFADALAGEGDNLILRAARAFDAAFGGGVPGFALDKRLPVAAGIGGGSADAAAALRLLAARAGVPLAEPRLLAIAAELGADVPACLASRAVRGTGRGDVLAPVAGDTLAGRPVLLVNPRVPLATGPVFRAWDGLDRGPLDPARDPLKVARVGRNDLQRPALAQAAVIGEVLALLSSRAGVLLARMSGSGATCFALFERETARDLLDRTIAAARPDWWRLPTWLRA